MAGRFDALTQLDKKPANPQAGKPASPKEVLPANPLTRLPVSPKEGKPANIQTRTKEKETVEKYTTRLEPGLIKQIKIYAAEHDLADYEVVKQAVEDYLSRKK